MTQTRTGLKVRQALELTLSGRSRREVAEALGIRPETVSRLISRPEAQAELSRLRTERMRALADQVSEAALQAVGVLKQVAQDPLAPAPARVGAAGRLLEFCLKAYELMDLAGRVERLEAEMAELRPPGRG